MAFLFWFCAAIWPLAAFVPLQAKRRFAEMLVSKTVDTEEWTTHELERFVACGLIASVFLVVLIANVLFIMPTPAFPMYMRAISALLVVFLYMVIGVSVSTFCVAMVACDLLSAALEEGRKNAKKATEDKKRLAVHYSKARKAQCEFKEKRV